jgi:hypothetical protein
MSSAAMEAESADVTLANVAPSKLLNYVKRDELVDFITPRRFAELEHRLKLQLNKERVNLKDMKKFLADEKQFMDSLRKHQTGSDAFAKYQAAAQRLRSMDRSSGVAVRKAMAEPRRRYQGCLATRLQPKDYEHCLDNYDSEEFDSVQLVPAGLKQRVHDRGSVITKGILAPSLTRRGAPTSDLPAGYRQYISNHPDQFKDYYEQRRHEVGLMKAVLRNLSSDDKRHLQEYYQEHKRIEPEKFSDIIRALPANNSSPKRQRAQVQDISGGNQTNRFDLARKVDLYGGRDGGFGDASIIDILN